MDAALSVAATRRTGRVTRVVGLTFEVAGVEAAIGDVVRVETSGDAMLGEVVAIGPDSVVAMPLGDLHGVRAGAPVEAAGGSISVPVGEELLGRVLDGLGRPLDDGPPLSGLARAALAGEPPHPLRRPPVEQPVHLGVRALDTMVPVGRGQRIGIFAGSGVGKSSLMSMIVRGTDADISVVALIGERGREVREFIERDLGPEGLARSVVVVATSDAPALVRLRAAFAATRIAEWFRDRGAHVNLLMDSLTRFAMAQREIGLSAGEVPATRGYPPSVFTLLPRLLERAGASEDGSITGIYTVLVEADDLNDPIGDSARSILDGHIALSRKLATAGHFPTIDVLESISRVAPAVTTPEQQAVATTCRRLMAAYREAKDLIEIGAYQAGTNPQVDEAVARRDAIDSFLRQGMDERVAPGEAWMELAALLGIGAAS
ncbi:FliI/YscN family ATPase [Actinomarinicola tropica]|uniref:FliI/YscN family ATPase n=1 Tax=Actinomarinicola tropica TaxID=2789776 RepID=A0A5Q2RS46_9ACTN|nr:FliI/YscN family ATPase [Actinomarinicola tropica]